MTTHDALLAAVLAAPGDDLPRLVFADHLDELDTDDSRARAEFIRVQVELAKYPHGYMVEVPPVSQGRGENTPDELRFVNLLRRQQELFPKGDRLYWGTGPYDHNTEFEYRRGFVEVQCTLAEWCGGPCVTCNGYGHHHRNDSLTAGQVRASWPNLICESCHGERSTPGIGSAVVRSHPVTRVVLTGVEPHENPLGESIFNRIEDHETAEHPSELPAKIFDLIGATAESRPSSARATIKRFPTREAAFSALSAALILWAKQQNNPKDAFALREMWG